jgi:hypothetical protein
LSWVDPSSGAIGDEKGGLFICRGIEISGLPLLYLRGGRGQWLPVMTKREEANKKMPDCLQFPRSGKAALQAIRHGKNYTSGWWFPQIGIYEW